MDINDDLKVDLVFKYSSSVNYIEYFSEQKDKVVFESKFWEKTFLVWFKLVLLEKRSSFENFISNIHFLSLSLEIIDDHEISILNKRWMNKTGPTDVLSFPILEANNQFNHLDCIELGDLFISIQTAISQANQYQQTIRKEMLWLASHGFLHLLGWEHNNNQELNKMLSFQEYLINKIEKN